MWCSSLTSIKSPRPKDPRTNTATHVRCSARALQNMEFQVLFHEARNGPNSIPSTVRQKRTMSRSLPILALHTSQGIDSIYEKNNEFPILATLEYVGCETSIQKETTVMSYDIIVGGHNSSYRPVGWLGMLLPNYIG